MGCNCLLLFGGLGGWGRVVVFFVLFLVCFFLGGGCFGQIILNSKYRTYIVHVVDR